MVSFFVKFLKAPADKKSTHTEHERISGKGGDENYGPMVFELDLKQFGVTG